MQEETIEILKKYSQEHILEYLSKFTKEEQENLEKQIMTINFEQLKKLYEQTKQKPCIEEKMIEYIPYTDKAKLSQARKESLKEIGKNIICAKKYAVITMAGGQGTRLGHSGPKGTYRLNTANGPKYIFEIIIDNLKKAQEEYGVTIPWYVMTSRENNEDTIKFLEEHSYFGYDKDKIKFFMQGELPLLNKEGKVIFDKEKKIKEAADGNGGIYEAIVNSGLLQEMQKEQIEWIFVGNVDNILAELTDTVLLGLTIEQEHKIGVKSVAKTKPEEKVGVFSKVNGKPGVIEYIDFTKEMAEERDENGELRYSEVNIGSYVFNRSVFENLADMKLPYHIAIKKSGYLTEEGTYIEPADTNIYKFEAFIFDAFARYDDITILRGKREEEFAPVKNSTGNDSPETAVALYNEKIKSKGD